MGVTTDVREPQQLLTRSALRATRASTQEGRRPDIQGMRAIGVLAVMLSHAGITSVAGGYVGVDVFFVISGFLITGIITREVERTGSISIAGFYARRAQRILPAAAVVLLSVIVVSAFTYTSGDLSLILTDVRWTTFFAQNINLAQEGSGYFSTDTFVSPVQHFWSLAVEEQFYLAWPLVIGSVAWVVNRRRGRSRASRRSFLLACAVVALVISAISLAWSVHATAVSPQIAYYSTFTRGYELGIGAAVAVLIEQLRQVPSPVKGLASWLGLAAVVVACATYTADAPFPGYQALLPVMGAALILAGGIDGPAWGARTVLGLRPMRFIGDISYSLYLWHWPMLVIPVVLRGHPISLVGRIGLMLASIVMAWLSYRFIESPVRSWSFIARRRRRGLMLWPAAVVAVLVTALGTQTLYVQTVAVGATTGSGPAATVSPSALRKDVLTAAQQARDGAPLPKTFQPQLTAVFDDFWEPTSSCAALTEPQVTHTLCAYGDITSSRTIVVWGDSHAGQWMGAISDFAKQAHLKVILIEKGSCVPLVDTLPFRNGSPYDECAAHNTWAMQQIARIKPERVILAGAYVTQMNDPGSKTYLEPAEADVAFQRGIQRTLSALGAHTKRIDVMSDNTSLVKYSGRCLGSRTATRASCVAGMHSTIASRNEMWATETAKVGAHFADMVPYLCDDTTCPIVIGNIVAYRDSNHLTQTYIDVLRPILAKKLGF
ncbi:acyltransferase family protein [Luteipulveratus mongoliensis]|uniref:Acyltransferase n=1 Tax=Luteipulveratus mongoliensis TaxID=571913 RepID=A0A0K1JM03_9MICO|nr:acyltransferase family protein [Luteipulveratus mongoliensis]AKU17736.1 hypothetical protein VV02_20930 [Luteipulveratus mongoliensis]